MDKKEIVTSDDIPSDPLSVPISDEEKKRIKNDPLYKYRISKNPKLKKQIKKIGESAMITIKFTSDSADAISRQWHIMFHIDDKSWNSWEVSNPTSSEGSHSFEVVSKQPDNRLDDDYLSKHLVAGVNMTRTVSKKATSESEIVKSVVAMDIDLDQKLDILLGESPEFKEAEEDDSKDGESDTVDDVQSMLTKMLPMTKDLKLGADKEKELKMHISKAMGLMKESITEGSTEARELELYITNDGDLYRQRHMPIIKNQMSKIAQGKFDEKLSLKLFKSLAEEGAKKYVKEFDAPGTKVSSVFSKSENEAIKTV